MKIYSEISLADFEWWSDAKDTAERITEVDKWDELEAILEDIEPAEGWTETALNDLLRFEPETVFDWLGINEDEEEEKDD